MGFLDDMAKKVGSVATEAGSKAKDVAGIAKLSAEIGSKEREIEKIYTEIGKVAYEYFKDDMPEDIKAVSYTHLDVYKRQHLCCLK